LKLREKGLGGPIRETGAKRNDCKKKKRQNVQMDVWGTGNRANKKGETEKKSQGRASISLLGKRSERCRFWKRELPKREKKREKELFRHDAKNGKKKGIQGQRGPNTQMSTSA